MMRCSRNILTGLLGAGLAACGCAGPSQRIRLDPQYVPSTPPTAYDDAPLAAVLRDYVDNGQVRYASLAENREPLERYLGLISVVGPETTPQFFPTADDRVCYYANVYNACALRGALEVYPATTVHTLRLPFEHGNRFRVDNRSATLGRLRERALSEAEGDPRLVFCLSSAAVGSPALAAEPLRSDRLQDQILDAVDAGLLNPSLVRVDTAHREIALWQDLVDRREEFVALANRTGSRRTTNLVEALASQARPQARRRLSSATDYEIRRLPFDRRLNDVPTPAAVSTPRPQPGQQ